MMMTIRKEIAAVRWVIQLGENEYIVETPEYNELPLPAMVAMCEQLEIRHNGALSGCDWKKAIGLADRLYLSQFDGG